MSETSPVLGTQLLIEAMKDELRAAGMTYADLAEKIRMSESSVKRMFSRREMPLSRIDEICQACKITFDELARKVVDAQPMVTELTPEQEEAVSKDGKLLLVAICCLSQWTFEQVLETYHFTEPELITCFTKLDRLGVIELKAMNRYRLKLAKTFRWRPDGPLMRYFRDHVIQDYFNGRFSRDGETVHIVHGTISTAMAPTFVDRLKRVGQDFSAQHLADQKLKSDLTGGYTLILAMREWEFAPFTEMRKRSKPPSLGAR